MRYSHYSYLPIDAFQPIFGRMRLHGPAGDVLSTIEDAVSSVGDTISSAVSDTAQAVGDIGNQIDQSVNDNVPGGWALPVAVTAAVLAPELLPEIAPAVEGTAAEELASAAPEIIDASTPTIGAGTSLSADAATNSLNPYYSVANPEVQANLGTVSNLVGGGAESNLATLDANPLMPTSGAGIGGSELGATGSIIGSGQGLGVQTLPETLAPTGLSGLTPNDLMSQPTNIANPSVTASDLAEALKKMNQVKNLFSTQTNMIAKNQQSLQNNQALSNMLRASQKTPFETPKEYRQGNPFTFEQPTLASLLRNNNYGN